MWGIIYHEFRSDIMELVKEVERIAKSTTGLTRINIMMQYNHDNDIASLMGSSCVKRPVRG